MPLLCLRGCLPRYICLGGATDPRPTDGTTGYVCSFGGYCPAGGISKQPCPAGTYNPDKIGQGSADCILCPPGKYCVGDTSTASSGPCTAGHICPGGASNPKQKRSPKGHYSQEGAATATPCPKGTYNPNEGQAECRPCVAGSVALRSQRTPQSLRQILANRFCCMALRKRQCAVY